jgi:ABC-type polysaccharide/polyol phosphate transport system ATPase subunit
MSARIEVRDISLTYSLRGPLATIGRQRNIGSGTDLKDGRVEAFKGLSFVLEPGDRLGLVGRNGAGKTTLLRVLAGILEPTSGALEITGRTDALFNINLGFRPEATGRRNIFLRGLVNGWTPAEIEAHTGEIIAFSELGDFIDMPYKTYSAGMAARLAFSIATHMQPEILLMDEWMGAGDAAFQKKAQERMQVLAEEAKILVIASHSEKLINDNCNKVLEMPSGSISLISEVNSLVSK